jgi:hypothetical protein
MDGNRAYDASVANPTDDEWQSTLGENEGALRSFHQILIQAAQALGQDFKVRRDGCYRDACAARVGQPELLAALWSPLHFRVRIREGSLTLGWQLVHSHGPRGHRRNKYTHIPTRNGGSDYDPYRLHQLAREHERDLVVATELRAVAIRKAWSAVVAMRGAHRTLVTSRTALTTTWSIDPP